MQILLTKASPSELSSLGHNTALSSLHQILICGIYVLSHLYHFQNKIWNELKGKRLYQVGRIRSWLLELQVEDQDMIKTRKYDMKDSWKKNVDRIIYQQSLFYILEVIRIKLISRYQNNPLAGYFTINKIRKIITQKYHWLNFCYNVKAYVTGCDICLTSKTVKHRLHGNLQSMSILTYWWKDLSMDFMTRLPVSSNWKD